MSRRALILAAALLLLLPACKKDRPIPNLTPHAKALLAEKADAKIGIIIKENLPSLFAGLVVFRSDVFVHQSAMLDELDISVLDSYGNAAILLLNSPDIPILLEQKSVKKIYYFSRQGPLARFHPAFEMDILRRFGEGKEAEPVTFMIRFQEPPGKSDIQAVETAGFHIESSAGALLVVRGPLTSLPRLLENDRIIFYEGASKTETM